MAIDFVLDVETLDTQDSAVLLSVGVVAVNFADEFRPEDLRKSSLFVKFNAADQRKRLGRSIDRDTLEFWQKQDQEVKNKNLLPSAEDVVVEIGVESIRAWMNAQGFDRRRSVVWTRGSLDGAVIQSIQKQLGVPPIFAYNRIRDVRTAVDILSGSNNGYSESSVPFENNNAHDPVDDSIRDALMLKYFVEAVESPD